MVAFQIMRKQLYLNKTKTTDEVANYFIFVFFYIPVSN